MLYGPATSSGDGGMGRRGLGPGKAVRAGIGSPAGGRGRRLRVFSHLPLSGGASTRECHARGLSCRASGSAQPRSPAYMEAFAARIGEPDLVICLDSGCGNYEQLWGTTSLRGVINGVLTVDVLSEGVHSGAASGIVPSSFRIARQLLSRLEDEKTGAVAQDFHVEIPPARAAEAREVAGLLGDDIAGRFPLVEGMRYAQDDPVALLLAGTWKPALSIIGAAGLPAPADGGNVLRPQTSLKLSLRIPPTLDAARASQRMTEILEADPPYGAKVRFGARDPRAGTRPPPSHGCSRPCTTPRAATSAGPPCSMAWAAPSRSWPCWASASPARSSSSRGRAVRARMRTGPTSSSTSRSPSASPPA